MHRKLAKQARQTQDPGLLESIYREFRLTGEVVRHSRGLAVTLVCLSYE